MSSDEIQDHLNRIGVDYTIAGPWDVIGIDIKMMADDEIKDLLAELKELTIGTEWIIKSKAIIQITKDEYEFNDRE